MNQQHKISNVFKAPSDNTRLAIIRHVMSEKEIACQELMKRFPLSQPTMSHHFNKLVNAGVLNNRKEGVVWFYTLNRVYLAYLGINIKKLITNTK
ncbi:MAG TPA: metalloregulator ArsR/SmtB family transcription factor [Candidatus Saccharimonadales bacterium]|nr:metalloregulator ArsR/SmtB family transcription factor [Candidatus Saccharimonadales bacterium]